MAAIELRHKVMSIQRFSPRSWMDDNEQGAYVIYKDHLEELEKLNKYKPTIYDMFIINYFEVNGGGAYELVTKYVTYNDVEKLLNELANKTSITQPSVYVIKKIEVEKEIKFTIKLPE